MIRRTISPTTILIILMVADLLFTGGLVSYITYNNQYRASVDQNTNQTSTEIKNLIKAINKTDQIDDIRTEYLLHETLDGLNKTYKVILENQKIIKANQKIIKDSQQLIKTSAELAQNNSAKNLNLTKFNRASLTDSNYVIREIAKQLNVTGLTPFNASKLN